jgi:hypothetical protein
MSNLIMYVLATIGMTHIIVDGSITESFRTFFKKACLKFNLKTLSGLVDCYLCAGTWCGFLMGYAWISNKPLQVFACGCAGGFLANFAAVLINYIEALTIVNLPQENHENL